MTQKRGLDRQRVWPGACCTICGGALYPGERYWQVNGVRSCEGCLPVLAKAEFAAHVVVCGEEGAAMTLLEMAAEYRANGQLLREALKVCGDPAERQMLERRIRDLTILYREGRETALMMERYYEGEDGMGVYRVPERALTYRDNEFLGDLAVWNRQHSEDNSEQMERLRRNLRKARETELTSRQRQMMRMYYDEGKTMTDIAHQLHVNKSTVSRTLARGRARLKKCLKYSF